MTISRGTHELEWVKIDFVFSTIFSYNKNNLNTCSLFECAMNYCNSSCSLMCIYIQLLPYDSLLFFIRAARERRETSVSL